MISLCIPTYEMKGMGATFLRELLDSIKKQTYTDYEVIVSDHSIDDSIKNVAEEYQVTYLRNENNRGNLGANFNYLQRYASGRETEHIKLLLQDDYLYDENSLQKEIDNLGDAVWGFCATIHRNNNEFYWHLIPEYTENIYTGANTIGSPSLMLAKNEECVGFDINLKMLLDCDFYKNMYNCYGLPKCSPEITTVSRIWEGQTQNTIDLEAKNKEIEYVKQKYSQ
jgi:glycosyltransferase involved in cell wall biosynthesis